MSARNIFLSVAGILIVIVLIIGFFGWKPFGNNFLVSSPNGNQTAATPAESAPSDVVVSHSASAKTLKEGTRYISVITYNGNSFTPRILVITRGENVRFVNASSAAMRIQLNANGTSTTPPTYQQAQSVGKNGKYELSFENPGVWTAYNLNDQSAPNSAVVYVK